MLVWRWAPQENDHVEKDEMLLDERGVQKVVECRDEDVMLLIRIGYKTLLVW